MRKPQKQLNNNTVVGAIVLKDQIHHLFTATLLLTLGAVLPQLSQAETTGDIFIPDKLLFDNPLKQSDGLVEIFGASNTLGLDNASLEQAAMHFRDNNMNTTQRALNYQWLHQHHHQSDVEYDSKVLSKLFKMGLRTYWDSMHKPSFLMGKKASGAASQGKQSGHDFAEEIQYDVKISGNKLKLSMDYKF